MPRTHFLIGVLITQILSFFGFNISLLDLLIGGLIAALVDLDHLFVYYRRHHNFNFLKSWYNAIKGLEYSQRSWIHEWNGFVFFGIVSFFVSLFSMQYAVIFLVAASSHIILDHEKFRSVQTKYIEFAHFVYPVSLSEIALDLIFIGINLFVYSIRMVF